MAGVLRDLPVQLLRLVSRRSLEAQDRIDAAGQPQTERRGPK